MIVILHANHGMNEDRQNLFKGQNIEGVQMIQENHQSQIKTKCIHKKLQQVVQNLIFMIYATMMLRQYPCDIWTFLFH